MSKRIALLLWLCCSGLFSATGTAETWTRVTTQHFVIYSNASEKECLRFAGQFERMRSLFHIEFPTLKMDPPSPIVVIAVKNEKDFRALEPEAYLAKGQLPLAGLFLRSTDKNYVLLRTDAPGEHPYETIYHEYTHSVFSEDAEWLPLWLNEGLAEFYQNTDIHEKYTNLGQASVDNVLWLRQNRLLPLETLFTVDYKSPYYHQEQKGSIFYAESWALTHYLEVKDFQNNTHKIPDYAELVSKGMDPITAATKTFGDLKQLQTAIDHYVEQSSFMALRYNRPLPVDESTFKTIAVPQVEADAVRADFLAYNQREKDSRAMIDQVLHEDPNNALVHETLGYMEFQQGHMGEALKWYEQAVKLDSHSYLAHYYYAAISTHQGQLDAEGQVRVENSFRTAIKLNPEFAPSYDQLAVFLGMHQRNLDEAHMLTLNAVQLDPTNIQYRINAAYVLVAQQREKDADAALQVALKLAKSPGEVAAIQNAMEMAQQSEASRQQVEEQNRRFKEEMAAESTATTGSASSASSADEKPVSAERLNGPHHFVTGTIKNVRCTSPSNMDLDVDGGGKILSFYTHNYYKLAFTALNYTPKGDLHPCSDLEGMQAKVEYVETGTGASKLGGLVSIELRK
jgi:tetratricopeptide (TPR) repeat protein